MDHNERASGELNEASEASPINAAMDQPVPVLAREREAAIDVLRGFALLGILVVNIQMFAFPVMIYTDPGAMLDMDQAWNRAGVWITNLFGLGKMIFLFSMLFGAGALFYAKKFEGGSLAAGAGLWYRRMAWLLLIGFIHALFVWYGDVLVWYAVIGMALIWWVRRLSPAVLIGLSILLMLIGAGILLGFTALMAGAAAASAETAEPLAQPAFDPTNPDHEMGVFRGSYVGMLAHRGIMLAFMYLVYVPFIYGPYLSGVMCLGMALVKTGFLLGRSPAWVYFLLAAVGLGSSVAISAWVMSGAEAKGYEGLDFEVAITQMVSAPLGGLGWAGLVLGLWKAGVLGPVATALGAVGRMALSNYLLTSVICTTIFYAYGFGLYADMDYPSLFLVVLGVWGVCTVFSLIWLRVLKMRFGPMEWLWRSLTYMRPVGLDRGDR